MDGPVSNLPPLEERDRGIRRGGDILVVDDTDANQVAMQAALEPLARRVVVASSGRDALLKLLEEDFSLILLDVQMPEMDGFETAAMIRGRERTKHTPIIFVTAHDRSEETMLRGYGLGAVDFLYKPLHAEILLAKTAALVGLADTHADAQAHARCAASGPSYAPHSPVHRAHTQKRAIVIEDDDDVRELTAELLTAYGYAVATAADGRSGVELLCSCAADVAFVDLGLPDISGNDVVREFKRRAPQHTTRLVAMTGFAQASDRMGALRAGFDLHVAKPIRLREVLATLALEIAQPV